MEKIIFEEKIESICDEVSAEILYSFDVEQRKQVKEALKKVLGNRLFMSRVSAEASQPSDEEIPEFVLKEIEQELKGRVLDVLDNNQLHQIGFVRVFDKKSAKHRVYGFNISLV